MHAKHVFVVCAAALLSCSGAASARLLHAVTHHRPRTHQPKLDAHTLVSKYADALKMLLTGELLKTPSVVPGAGNVSRLEIRPFDKTSRVNGVDWPQFGLTMVGRKRLTNIEELLLAAIDERVDGDFVECGVWRGGASLFAKAVLDAADPHGGRMVHLVDSFHGLPPPTAGQDRHIWSEMDYLRVSKQEVQSIFEEMALLDGRVRFHEGYFRYSAPSLRKQLANEGRQIALLRMDGDMYESTMDILFNLYDLVAVGGCIVIDDYSVPECRRAMDKFFHLHNMHETFHVIDDSSSYFCKTHDVKLDAAWYDDFNKNRKNENE